MLKTVSSVANAIGALNYKGTWNASTNAPTLASGVGTQGDYYVVSVAGATDLDGITNWGVGDWAAFNGSVWQRVEGGADGNFVNLTVTGEATVGNIKSTVNTISSTDTNGLINLQPNGTGYVFVRAPSNGTIAKLGDGSSRTFFIKQANVGGFDNDTLIIESDSGVGQFQWKNGGGERLRINTGGDVKLVTGNLVIGTSGKGIDFSATGTGTGATSELFDDYEEGVWTPTYTGSTSNPTITYDIQYGIYVKVGRLCQAVLRIRTDAVSGGSGNLRIGGLPFSAFSAPTSSMSGGITVNRADSFTTNTPAFGVISNGNDYIDLNYDLAANAVTTANLTNAANSNTAIISLVYQTA